MKLLINFLVVLVICLELKGQSSDISEEDYYRNLRIYYINSSNPEDANITNINPRERESPIITANENLRYFMSEIAYPNEKYSGICSNRLISLMRYRSSSFPISIFIYNDADWPINRNNTTNPDNLRKLAQWNKNGLYLANEYGVSVTLVTSNYRDRNSGGIFHNRREYTPSYCILGLNKIWQNINILVENLESSTRTNSEDVTLHSPGYFQRVLSSISAPRLNTQNLDCLTGPDIQLTNNANLNRFLDILIGEFTPVPTRLFSLSTSPTQQEIESLISQVVTNQLEERIVERTSRVATGTISSATSGNTDLALKRLSLSYKLLKAALQSYRNSYLTIEKNKYYDYLFGIQHALNLYIVYSILESERCNLDKLNYHDFITTFCRIEDNAVVNEIQWNFAGSWHSPVNYGSRQSYCSTTMNSRFTPTISQRGDLWNTVRQQYASAYLDTLRIKLIELENLYRTNRGLTSQANLRRELTALFRAYVSCYASDSLFYLRKTFSIQADN